MTQFRFFRNSQVSVPGLPTIALCLIFCLFSITSGIGQTSDSYDIVLNGGRVIDPETGLNDVRNIGITDGRIAAISSQALSGKQQFDVSGLVVSPGFIDLHIHGITNTEQEYQVRDGVTTALELEWGIPLLKQWYESRANQALINYGASVNWPFSRIEVMQAYEANTKAVQQMMAEGKYEGVVSSIDLMLPTFSTSLTDAELPLMLQSVRESLSEGGIGIGVPVGYLPKASTKEVYALYQMAGEMQAPIFTHVRAGGIIAIQQAIADAILTGAPLHIVHMNSMALGDIDLALNMVRDAGEKGFGITTEVYPYTAASTDIASAMFDDGWQDRLGMTYADVQWVPTAERLTEKSFEAKRKEGGTVIMHMMQPEWIRSGVAYPEVIIASDGMFYDKLAHPRTAGTFSRVLGKYTREDKVLGLIEALKKMTLLPAQRLESIAPMMRFKGRLQVGADADITVFDPTTIKDKATFEKGLEFSEGIVYVVVNGVLVVKDGKTVENVFPGQPIYGKYKK